MPSTTVGGIAAFGGGIAVAGWHTGVMPASTAPVYRAPMRSRSDAVPEGAAVERALATGVCGLGGRLAAVPATLAAAVIAVAAEHDERMARRLERFTAAPDGAVVWTRDVEGFTHLGRLRGPWRYDGSALAAAVDLVHVRDCEWLPAPIPERDVPPAVQLTFSRGGRNWQQTHDDAVGAQSMSLWRAHGRD